MDFAANETIVKCLNFVNCGGVKAGNDSAFSVKNKGNTSVHSLVNNLFTQNTTNSRKLYMLFVNVVYSL